MRRAAAGCRRARARWPLLCLLAASAWAQAACNARGSARRLAASDDEAPAVAAPSPPAAADPSAPAAKPSAPDTQPSTPLGPPRCATADLRLCDSFEDAAVGGPPQARLWQVVTTGADSSVAVDASRAARGRQSVRVHTGNAGYAQAILRTQSGLPYPGGVLWGRAFVYYASDANLPQMHWTLFEGTGLLPGGNVPTQLRYGGQFTHLMANYFGQDQYAHAALPKDGGWTDQTLMPANRWACFEWQFKQAGNEMHLYLDGDEVPRVAIFGISTQCCPDQPWIVPPIDTVHIGWQIYQQDPSQKDFTLWVDEVALDPNRIGCTR